ncbi:MAG: hypothetical protein BGO67_09130 [Alphaproteobacteria bacterium 41-28]|nr:MAG: hypothetical protein BGO67_09130 [Alphaproteobacteria bacterium 41-28]
MRKRVLIGAILATLPLVGVHAMPEKDESTKHPKSKPPQSPLNASNQKNTNPKGNEGGQTPGKVGLTGEKFYLD